MGGLSELCHKCVTNVWKRLNDRCIDCQSLLIIVYNILCSVPCDTD
jgi:hypothetical protein